MSRINKIMVGEIEVISLTDGAIEFRQEVFSNADEKTISDLLKLAGKTAIETNFNAFLIRSGADTLLLDAGPGDLFGPSCGFLNDAMAEVGVTAQDITHLFLTHMHSDHFGGMVSAEDEVMFPSAQFIMSETDKKYILDHTNFTHPALQGMQKLGIDVLNAYTSNMELINGEETLISGVTALPMPGHTPGHYGFRVDDGDHGFINIGDAIHAQDLQLTNPDISVIYDTDQDMARATRKRALDMVATDGLLFSGGHILQPTIGRLKRKGAGYSFQAEQDTQ